MSTGQFFVTRFCAFRFATLLHKIASQKTAGYIGVMPKRKNMNSTIEHYQEVAKSKLAERGKELCKEYTFGWGGPIEWAIEMFPYIRSSVLDIKDVISDFPICVFQTRDLQPNNMIAVVPFKTPDGNPTNTRVLPSSDISSSTLETITEFSQAFLFLLSTGALPSPLKKEKLTSTIISLTNKAHQPDILLRRLVCVFAALNFTQTKRRSKMPVMGNVRQEKEFT